jgi:hypothetical protein
MEHHLIQSMAPKHVCIVSKEEDFRLRLAVLLSNTCDITLCDDLGTMLDVALVLRKEMIAVVDSTLWRGNVLQKMKAYRLEMTDHPIYILRFYPYQLEGEMIDDTILYYVDSVWMRKILGRKHPLQGVMEAIHRCLSNSRWTNN